MKSFPLSRRRFLQKSCLLGAALLGSQFLSALPGHAFGAVPSQGRDRQETRPLMGTWVSILAYGLPETQLQNAFESAFAEMNRLIAMFDCHAENSLLGTLNRQEELAMPPPEFSGLIRRAQAFAQASSHTFNPAVKPFLDLVLACPNTLSRKKLDPELLRRTLKLADFSKVQVSDTLVRLERTGMALTLDGIAKGSIVDAAARVLHAHGLENFLINAGGDILAQGKPLDAETWKIGIKNPARAGSFFETIGLNNQAVATSAGYEQALPGQRFERMGEYNHLINPHTGTSAQVLSASAVAPSTETADALATAAALLPPHQALQLAGQTPHAACLIIDAKGRRYASKNWGKNLA